MQVISERFHDDDFFTELNDLDGRKWGSEDFKATLIHILY